MPLLRAAVRRIAESPLFASTRRTWEKNQRDAMLPLSKWQKATTGLYLVAADWASGSFPPRFQRDTTWNNEIACVDRLPGMERDEWYRKVCAAPFGFADGIGDDLFEHYLDSLRHIHRMLLTYVRPPARVLELGCGHGWLCEILAGMGYDVTGTTIVPDDICCAQRRIAAIRAKGIMSQLQFEVCPMETVGDRFSGFDCVLIHEALHHAFDWKETVRSVAKALRPGGWFLICREPNLAHTFISYRVAKITNTHEVGISRPALKRELRSAGFSRIEVLSSPLHFWVRWHWIAAQLPS